MFFLLLVVGFFLVTYRTVSAGYAPPGFITSGFAVEDVSASDPLVLLFEIMLPVVVVVGFIAGSCVGDGCAGGGCVVGLG